MFDENILPNAANARTFTNAKLAKMRAALADRHDLEDILIGTNGSYARREASKQSDLDFFVICRLPQDIDRAQQVLNEIAPTLIDIAGRKPATGGVFGVIDDLPTILTNIGGNDDLNPKITRRVLLLLEGEWLTNKALFEESRNALLERYIRPQITSPQLALFLLNDIIRYYRTVCVDFEFKTVENNKEWGLRNIKLVFSRKLLYFSGVLAVAETMQRSRDEKIRVLTELFDRTLIDRILAICGDQAYRALTLYDFFLHEIATEEVRRGLAGTQENDRTTEPFRRLKDESHHFSMRLLSLFRQTYEISHPIHRLIFL